MVLLGDESHVDSCFSRFEMELVSVQDWCMVCVKQTMGSEMILDALDGTPR
jgi:hypothetical protein